MTSSNKRSRGRRVQNHVVMIRSCIVARFHAKALPTYPCGRSDGIGSAWLHQSADAARAAECDKMQDRCYPPWSVAEIRWRVHVPRSVPVSVFSAFCLLGTSVVFVCFTNKRTPKAFGSSSCSKIVPSPKYLFHQFLEKSQSVGDHDQMIDQPSCWPRQSRM